jgi:hypothetical protein
MYVIMNILTTPKQGNPLGTESLIENSSYKIKIEHANWGLNCHNSTNKNEDNVLDRVSQICNGRSKCAIAINTSTLGEDPVLGCGYKILKVDYRCFTVDRLNSIKAKEGALLIDCDKQFSNP